MFSTFSLCLVLVCSLGLTLGQDEQTAGRKPGNFIPLEEWEQGDIEALYYKKKSDKGRSMNVVTGELDSLNRIYCQHVKENNCGALINMYDPNVMMVGYDGTIMKGVEAIQFTLSALENVAAMNITSLAVSPLGANARFVFQHVRGTASDREGNMLYTGESFLIWKRNHEGLRIYAEIYDLEEQTY